MRLRLDKQFSGVRIELEYSVLEMEFELLNFRRFKSTIYLKVRILHRMLVKKSLVAAVKRFTCSTKVSKASKLVASRLDLSRHDHGSKIVVYALAERG